MYMFIRFYFSLLRLSVKRATLMLFHHAMTYLEIANCQMSQKIFIYERMDKPK